MLKTYLQTLSDGLYELHARGAVRSEGADILQSLRTTAEQALSAADEAAQAQAQPLKPDEVAQALHEIRAGVAELRALFDTAPAAQPGAEG